MRYKRARVRVVRRRRTQQGHEQREEQREEQRADCVYVPSAALPAFPRASDVSPLPPRAAAAAAEANSSSSSPCGGESPSMLKEDSGKQSEWKQPAVRGSSGPSGGREDTTTKATGDGEKNADEVVVAWGTTTTTTTFPSQPFADFQVTFLMRGETHIKVAVQSLKTDETWESELMELSEFVTTENRIPMATLDDYIKCFKDSLKALGGDRVPHPDLVPAVSSTTNRHDMRLEITLQVRVLSHQWLAKYGFLLLRVEKKDDKEFEKGKETAHVEIAAMQKQLQAQESEIASLKARVVALQKVENCSSTTTAKTKKKKKKTYGVYFRATAFMTVERGEEIDWLTQRTCDGFFKVKDSLSTTTTVEFTKPGSFAVLVVVHHSNCDNDAAAFQLLLNGKCVQSCYASSPNGSRQSSTLMHCVRARARDKLSVVYTGSGSCEPTSCLEVDLVE